MGEMNREQLMTVLRGANPTAPVGDMQMYLDAYQDYCAAQANIAEHGAIVLHPRTGAPIENPYLKVRGGALATMKQFGRLKTDGLWS